MAPSCVYLALSIVALFALVGKTNAFGVVPAQQRANFRYQSTTTSLNGMFGGLAGAFANDESLGERKNAGLSKGPKFNENVTVNGKKVQGAVAGQKLTAVAAKVRVRIPVNCQKGDCGTCMVKMNGRKLKGTYRKMKEEVAIVMSCQCNIRGWKFIREIGLPLSDFQLIIYRT